MSNVLTWPETERRALKRRTTDEHSTKKTIKKEIKERIERVSLIRHSLLSTRYQNRHHKVGISQLLNRFFALLQDYTIIVVLEGNKYDSQEFKIIYHTMQDPVWQKDFEAFLENKGEKRGDHIYWKAKDCSKDVHPIHRTKLFAFYHADFRSLDRTPYGAPPFIPYDEAELEESFITDLLDEFHRENTLLHELYFNEELNERFKDREECWENGHYNPRLLSISDPRPISEIIKFSSPPNIIKSILGNAYEGGWPNGFFKQQDQKIEGLFNDLYKTIHDSPLLHKYTDHDQQESLPNIIFSARRFTQEELRYKGKPEVKKAHYPYRSRTYLSEKQKEKISTLFKKLKKSDIPKDRKFDGKDDFFWEEIKNEKFDYIFNIVEMPEGLNARCLSDMAYAGGFVWVSDNPYGTQGRDRLDQDIWEQANRKTNKVISDDYKRLVYHHYIDFVIAPTGSKPSVMLVPIQVGAAAWGCISYVLNPDEDSRHDRWIDGYHFYHSISFHLVKEVRRQLKQLYFSAVQEIYYYLSLGLSDRVKNTDEKFIDEFSKLFNKCTHELCRIYPFKQVKLARASSDDFGNIMPVLNKYEHKISLEENLFFVERIKGSFITEDIILDKLDTAEERRIAAEILSSKSTPSRNGFNYGKR